ncbi:MAG: FHA domain-containing protein [Hyalangium sp.]|uniref:FHA domain-containing protein n=1 Tax=Hyalangium sp. TaxID=2028555 RepID=UPI003899B0A7
MHFEFEHLGTTTPFELAEGQHLLGGGPEDQVRLEALPPAFLTLRIESSRLTVEAVRPFTVNAVLVPPGVPRLVLPGEVVGLPEEMRLKVLQAPDSGTRGMGTAAVLKHLLSEGADLPPSRAPTLTCLTGLDVGRTFPLSEAKTDLGRGTQVDLRLRDRAVSRSHARILREGSSFTLVDLDSPNGVYLNGRRVKVRTPLAEGNVIELGQTLLRFQAAVEDTAPPAPALAEAPPPVEAAAASALPQDAPPNSLAGPAREMSRAEVWLIGLGVATALAGVLVTYALLS